MKGWFLWREGLGAQMRSHRREPVIWYLLACHIASLDREDSLKNRWWAINRKVSSWRHCRLTSTWRLQIVSWNFSLSRVSICRQGQLPFFPPISHLRLLQLLRNTPSSSFAHKPSEPCGFLSFTGCNWTDRSKQPMAGCTTKSCRCLGWLSWVIGIINRQYTIPDWLEYRIPQE